MLTPEEADKIADARDQKLNEAMTQIDSIFERMIKEEYRLRGRTVLEIQCNVLSKMYKDFRLVDTGLSFEGFVKAVVHRFKINGWKNTTNDVVNNVLVAR